MHPKTLWFAIALLLVLMCLTPAALGAAVATVYATAGEALTDEETGELNPEAVRWWYSEADKVYYLFMPSHTQALRLWVTGEQAATLDGQAWESGADASALLDGQPAVLAIGKKSYTLVVMRSANVPAMFMTTESGSLDYILYRKGNAETGTLHMVDSGGEALYDGKLAQIKGRGNATFVYNKKPYQLKLDKGTDLCGMGKAKTWILLAEHLDNSLLRNKVAFALASAVGMPYVSQSQTVDVYINHDYLGAYLLCEKVEIGDTRIDIDNLAKATEKVNDNALDSFARYGYNSYRLATQKGFKIPVEPEDITGGYLLEMDYKMRYDDEASGFVTRQGQAVVVKEPEAASQSQITYIAAFFQGFENAIRAADGKDAKTGKHYSEFVDMASLVRKYLLEEVLKNRDANRSSLYFYKPADSESAVAFAGPAWDYDASMGNFAKRKGDKGLQPQYFAVNNDQGESFYIFPKLYAQADFQEAVVAMFYADYVPALETLLGIRKANTDTLKPIREYAAEIEACAAMNFTRWPVFNAKSRIAKTGATYQENIDYLCNFLQERLTWLQTQWQKP